MLIDRVATRKDLRINLFQRISDEIYTAAARRTRSFLSLQGTEKIS